SGVRRQRPGYHAEHRRSSSDGRRVHADGEHVPGTHSRAVGGHAVSHASNPLLPHHSPAHNGFRLARLASASVATIAYLVISIRSEFHLTRLEPYRPVLLALFLGGVSAYGFSRFLERAAAARTFSSRIAISLGCAVLFLFAAEWTLRYTYRDVHS